VNLTTVLHLARGENANSSSVIHQIDQPIGHKYFITSQNDLYQVDQFVKFILPLGGVTLVAIWHWFAKLCCVIGATLLQPVQPFFAELGRPLSGPSERARRTRKVLGQQFRAENGTGHESIQLNDSKRRGVRELGGMTVVDLGDDYD
jgi:hypothetical protein